jgi:iron-regulated transporter 1
MNRRLCLAGLLLLARSCFAQYGYNYDANYYDDYSLYTAGYHYDMYDEDDEGLNFNPYTNSYDDAYGDYYFDDVEEEISTCRLGEDGKPKFNETQPCNLKLEGADALLEGLSGGVDGKYEVWSCENGRPMYKRANSPKNENRVLWYSQGYRDWDLANGTLPQDDDILVFGGSGGREKHPEYVTSEWSIASEFLKTKTGSDEYSKFPLKVTCEDGSKPEVSSEPFDNFGRGPMLTDVEMENQYREVYKRAAAKDSSAEVNLGMVTLFVMIGLGVVFGLPYMVARTRKQRRSGRGSAGPLSSILDLSRKRGHSN